MDLRDEDFENVNPGEPRIFMLDGQYPAQFIGRKSKHYSWGEKLIFHWRVFISRDLTESKTLDRYYNAHRDKAGRFLFGDLHGYRKDWIAANGGKHPSLRSRLPITIFGNSLFLVEVISVREDSDGHPLSPSLYWSKVKRVIRPLEEGENLQMVARTTV